VNSVMPLPLSLPTPANRRFLKAKRTLDGIVDGIIERKKRVGPEHENDLLSMLMLVRDQDTGEGMSDQQIHDSVMTLVIGGHETTANTLAWAWYLLAKNPEVVSKLQQELDQVLGGRAPTLEDLPKLVYLSQVVDEVLRLYPATWILARRALKDDVIMGYRIPAKSVIYFSPWITQHDPKYWEDPERFDPDRFLPERVKDRPRSIYYPFGLGPRQCIGGSFAIMEIQIVLAMGLQRLRPRLAPGHTYDHKLMIVLRPRNGIKLLLEPREQAPSEGTKLTG
jgi:cytochrome P450